jgi:hypothetical protein
LALAVSRGARRRAQPSNSNANLCVENWRFSEEWRVIELIEKDHGGYEVRKSPYGKVCIWYPDHFVLECECGGLLLCNGSASLCQCGADHSDLVRDLFDNQTSVGNYPWYEDSSLVPEEGPFSLG